MPRIQANAWQIAGISFYAGITLGFALVALLSANPPFLRDYGNWVYQGDVLAKALSGHPVALYQFKHYPVPNSLVTIGLGVLTRAFGWLWAAKIWLAFSILVNSAAAFFAARAFQIREAALWFALPGAFLFGQSFWFATLSFNLGFSVLFLLAALLYRREQSISALAALLLLCFFIHLIIYAAAFVMILLYCAESRVRRPLAIALITTPLAAWYMLGRMLTHSDESQLGHSSPLHIAVPVLVGLAALAAAFFLPAKPLARRIAPWLISLSSLLALAALATLLLPARAAARASSAIATVQLKALAPFSLFGFINLMQTPADPPFSYSWRILHPPLFLALLALCILAGAAVMIAGARALLAAASAPRPNATGFLWSFVALFAFAYLVCPPNALGVIGIDMRLAQLALGIALFLLAQRPSRTLRWISPVFVVLVLASLFQFQVSQSHLYLPKADTGLPNLLANFGGIEGRYMEVYDRVRTGNFGGFFFDTGLFAPTTHPATLPAR
jgi:hypothetical protein